MSNGLTMFPEDYKDFVDKYSTKEPKFGEEWIPKLKVLQALEHYTSDNSKDIVEKIEDSPYFYMSICQEIINNRMRDQIIKEVRGY